MKHPAVKELIEIMKVRDWTEFCPEKTRIEKLEQWVDKWVMEVEQSQRVVDKKYLASEHMDTIKYKLGQELGDILSEECVSYTTENTKVTGRMIALRRKGK